MSEQVTEENGRSEYEQGEKEPLNHGVKIRAKLKRDRGGTRNQDELLIEGRGEDAIEAAADFEKALECAESNDWVERLDELEPEVSD
jgi:hypothetical protein